MSHHQLGQGASARIELQRARDILEGKFTLEVDKLSWTNWLGARVLFREAAALVPNTQPLAPAKAP
jgi:hypothetical protein